MEFAVSLGRVTVAEDNGMLIGWLQWNLFWDNMPFMNMLFKLKNIGVNQKIMDWWCTMSKRKDEITIYSSTAEYLTYVAAIGDNADSMEMRYEDENIWLTQRMMAQLYDVSVQNIGQHIKKILDDGELVEEAVVKKYFITAADGKQYSTKHYNLQMIIAGGFKVNNDRAVRFREWSGQIVKDYTIQGWTMDKERLKKGHMFTDEYFER